MKQECTCSCGLHEEIAKKVKDKMLSDDLLFDIAEVFKIFGDSTRIKIIYALKLSELCVCDLTYITNSTQSAISHQLRILKQAKLIKARKDGKVVYYSLKDSHVTKLFMIGREHVEEL
ncbi:MAG: metalloregulator ArsR/SmtB family transcription factor [Ruminococcus sp.]|nr:metalloregulator ArsR/SmtB family transcription factor [Ruminococcus sp.]